MLKERWGVIFDMDGVLIDSYNAHFISWKEMLKGYGLVISEDQFASTFGRTNEDIILNYFPDIKMEEIKKMAEKKERIFRRIIKERPPVMEGAEDLIKILKDSGALLGIGSSAPIENIKAVLEILPYGDHFRFITSGDEIIKGKPDPEVFLKTVEKMGLMPDRCLVLEDAPSGVEAGKRAGCKVIALTGTAKREELYKADLIVDSLKEIKLKDFLRLLNPASTLQKTF